VALGDRRGQRMGAATAKLSPEGAKAVFVADMLDKEVRPSSPRSARRAAKRPSCSSTHRRKAMAAAIDKVLASEGQLDVLVNNAGISGSAEQDLYDTAAWERLMASTPPGLPRHEARHRRDEEARSRLGDQPVVDLGIVGQSNIHVA